MQVALFVRLLTKGSFSIENLFDIIAQHFSANVKVARNVMPYTSNGIFKRIANMLWTWHNRSAVNHVTGDVHYVVMALPARRTILTVHDCVTILHEKNAIKRWAYKWIWFTLPVRHARFVTVISKQTKKDLMQITGCPEEKIVLIPDCIDPRFLPQEKVFNPHKPRILQIGQARNKNIPRLAEALKGIACHLHIVGILYEEITSALERNKIEYTHNSGLSFDDLLKEYHKADIVAFASTYEGFGLPILEAQAVGRVVMTGDLSPMKEVAGNGAMLVDPFNVNSIRDGVLEIIHNETLRNDLIMRGFANVQRYSPSYVAEQYEKLYERLVRER